MKKIFAVILALVLTLTLLSACSKAEPEQENSDSVYQNSGSAADGALKPGPEKGQPHDRKIIANHSYGIETKAFDILLPTLRERAVELGGYIENSSVYGAANQPAGSERRAVITARIPSARVSEFTGFISKNSVIVSESVSTEDVTLSYIDTESRLAALRSEKAAVEKLLDKSGNMGDIVLVYDKLSQIIYEIESLEAKLKAYDNQIEYTSVTINISEVERTKQDGTTVWQKIGAGFSDNLAAIGRFFENAFVFLVGGIPYIILAAAVGGAVTIIIKRKLRLRSRGNKQQEPDNSDGGNV